MAGLKRAADGGAPEEEAKRLAMEGLQVGTGGKPGSSTQQRGDRKQLALSGPGQVHSCFQNLAPFVPCPPAPQGQPAAPLPGAPAEEERGAEDKQDDELDDFGIPRGRLGLGPACELE